MPIEPVILDSSQRPTELVGSVGNRVRVVEAAQALVPEVLPQTAVEPIADDSGNPDALLLLAEFEAERLEANTRLALTVERVDLDPGNKALKEFQRTVPVILLGSLSIDVRI